MSAVQWLGVAMLAVPFVVMFCYMAYASSIWVALAIFGTVAAVAAFLMLGSFLAVGALA